MTADEFRLLLLEEEFNKPNGELRMRDHRRYCGSNITVLRRGRYCTQCEKRIADDDFTALNIVITDRDVEFGTGPEGMARDFCDWECAANWFEAQVDWTVRDA